MINLIQFSTCVNQLKAMHSRQMARAIIRGMIDIWATYYRATPIISPLSSIDINSD